MEFFSLLFILTYKTPKNDVKLKYLIQILRAFNFIVFLLNIDHPCSEEIPRYVAMTFVGITKYFNCFLFTDMYVLFNT